MSLFDELVSFSEHVSIPKAGPLVEGANQSLRAACDLLRHTRVELPSYCAETFDNHLDHVRSLRQLWRGLQQACCESKADNDLDRAASYVVGLFDLGRVFCNGGLMLNLLISIDITRAAVDEVRTVRKQISSVARQIVIEATERFERESDSIEVIIDRDRKWDIENADPEIIETSFPSSIDASSCEEEMVIGMINDFIALPRATQNSQHAIFTSAPCHWFAF